MSATATSHKVEALAESRSLLDDLIASVTTGNGKQRQRILQRVADLFAAGSRNYSRDQIALFDDVLQKLSADIEVEARARLADQLAVRRSLSARWRSTMRSRLPSRYWPVRPS
jgi:uncharacterized protein (DUF2336 family)